MAVQTVHEADTRSEARKARTQALLAVIVQRDRKILDALGKA